MSIEDSDPSEHTATRPEGALRAVSGRSLIGPWVSPHRHWLRYSIAAALLAAVALIRLGLSPWLGMQAPLLPFLVAVLVSAWMCGRGPALLISVLAPPLATVLFTAWPHGTHPLQWSLHIALFLSAALLVCFVVDRLQTLHHGLQAALAAAHAAQGRAAQRATQLHLALCAGRAGSFDWNIRANLHCWSEELEALYGFAPGEFACTHEAWLACIVPEDRERILQLTASARAAGDTVGEYCIRRRDTGEIRWLQVRGEVCCDDSGKPQRMLGIHADITERVQAEAAVRESEHRLRLLADHLPAYVGYLDREGYFRFANAAYRELASGDAPLVGRALREFLGEEVYAQRQPYVERVLRGELVQFEGPLRHPQLGFRECAVAYVPDVASTGDTVGFYVMVHDITERTRAERALREQEQMLQLIYDHASDSLFLLLVEPDDQYRFVSVNATFLEVSGYAQAQAQGQLIEAVMPSPILERARTHLRIVHATREPVTYYETASSPAGLRHGEVTLVPIINEERVITHVLGAVKDVTARKQAEAALLEADRRKDEFLAMLAHELRNPLAAIRNVGHLLARDHSDPARVHRYGESLDRQATQLTRLLDDLLDVARITRGHIELRREPLALSDILDAAIETTQPLFTVKRQVLNFTRDPAPWVEGDAVRLVQVFSNLLTNASKFSPDRSMIEVLIGHSVTEVTVRIRDEGAGIDPELLPRIFELFVQADRSLDRTQGGLGVGLTIAKTLVDRHGGRLEAKSAGLGAGSEFAVTLPRAAAPTALAAGNAAPAPRSRRILIVDDNADVVETLAMLLRLEGHLVQTAPDGMTGLAVLETFEAEIILLDIGLPGADGYVVAQSIRERFANRSHRLFAVSGYGREEDRALARSSGFDGHLTKPVEPEALLQLIRESTSDPMPTSGH